MPPITALRFDNSYARLPPDFHEVIDPVPLPDPHLVAFNPDAARLLDLEADDPEALVPWLAGNRRIPGAEPLAMLYAGHQFGVWVPQLGDGRAILLGEVRNDRGQSWDLHLKGAGPTRFARGGDGRAVLRSAIREYLASEAMAGLGIPTTRALSITGSTLPVERETTETAAALIRLSPSHVRFGTFEVFASRDRPDLVRVLADYVIARHFPGLEERYPEWLEAVTVRTARLMAEWQAAGFAHGVMNTDNMSVIGVTLDYGPYAFLDAFDPDHVGNHSDHEGRYAFGRQPSVALWNLLRFAEALLSLMPRDDAQAALDAYWPAYAERFGRRMRARLGLATEREEDAELTGDLFRLLHAQQADYTRFFTALGTLELEAPTPEALLREARNPAALDPWLERYRARLRAEASDDGERQARMGRANPAYVLRNWLAERAIRKAVDEGDYTEIERLRLLLRFPYSPQPGMEEYAAPPPDWARDLVVSCSS